MLFMLFPRKTYVINIPMILKLVNYCISGLFSIWVFFHDYLRFIGQFIYLTPLYHFHPLHTHLTSTKQFQTIAESSWTRTGNPKFPDALTKKGSPKMPVSVLSSLKWHNIVCIIFNNTLLAKKH